MILIIIVIIIIIIMIIITMVVEFQTHSQPKHQEILLAANAILNKLYRNGSKTEPGA